MEKVHLHPHQKRVVEYMRTHDRLILYHSTGSGKTLTSLSALSGGHITVIGPKSAKRAFQLEGERLGLGESDWTFYTFARARTLAAESPDFCSGRRVIVDEAHALRSDTLPNMHLTGALTLASKLLLCTATPIVNDTVDLAVLVNLVRGESVLPLEKRLFRSMYLSVDEETDPPTYSVANARLLESKLRGTLSFYRAPRGGYYPTVERVVHRVEMDKSQTDLYGSYVRQYIYGDVPLRESALFQIDFRRLSSRAKNYFLTATRQISNTSAPGVSSPKLRELDQVLADGPKPAVVYSFYLDRGIFSLVPLLEERKTRWASITGSTSPQSLQRIVREYNEGKYEVLLLSSAGSESLDLRGTRQFHQMESQWNDARTDQAEGRVIRYGSHNRLPESERVVTIHTWLSIFPTHIRNQSADLYLHELTEGKRRLKGEYEALIRAASIEGVS